ncbi:MAG: DMT family transporter [bacterium]|nr:DMT family transporter [bacterium]
MTNERTKLIYPLIILGQLIAGGTFPIAKLALQYFEPFTLAVTRFVIASVAMFAIVKFSGRLRKIERVDWGKFVWLGLLAVPLNQLLFLYGLKFTTPGRSALYYGATPAFVFMMAIWYLKERVTIAKVAGIVISFLGVALILRAGRFDADILFGDILVILAVIAWAGYTIFGKPLIAKYGPMTTTAYALLIGTALYLPFGLIYAVKFDYAAVPAAGWLSLLYIAIITSVIAYSIWFWALGRMEASKLSIFQNLQPIIATILSVLFFGEILGWEFYVGGAMVITGVIVTQRG